jgi:hypothetical protein
MALWCLDPYYYMVESCREGVLCGIMAASMVDKGYADSALKTAELFDSVDGFESECMRCLLRVCWSG